VTVLRKHEETPFKVFEEKPKNEKNQKKSVTA
jgi:hypothetical protein